MQIKNRPFLFFTALALVAASTLVLSGAFAGDEVTPSADVSAAATDTSAEKAEAPATRTTSPVHTLMGWMATRVVGDLESPCPSCPKSEAAWRSWFSGGADVPLAALRDQLVADGWTADRYIGYFQAMAKSQPKSCGDCDKECGDCDKSSTDCDKDCSDCPSKASGNCDKDCGDCPSKGASNEKGCDGCPEGKTAKQPEAQSTAAK